MAAVVRAGYRPLSPSSVARRRRDCNPLADGTLASVKFGLYGLHKGENTAPEALARRAREAEEAGFESIWVGDHIALPPDAPDDAYDPRLEASSRSRTSPP